MPMPAKTPFMQQSAKGSQRTNWYAIKNSNSQINMQKLTAKICGNYVVFISLKYIAPVFAHIFYLDVLFITQIHFECDYSFCIRQPEKPNCLELK